MGYNEAAKRNTIKYLKDKQKTLTIRFKKDEYENIIVPAAKAQGLPIATFIKKCIKDSLEKDQIHRSKTNG